MHVALYFSAHFYIIMVKGQAWPELYTMHVDMDSLTQRCIRPTHQDTYTHQKWDSECPNIHVGAIMITQWHFWWSAQGPRGNSITDTLAVASFELLNSGTCTKNKILTVCIASALLILTVELRTHFTISIGHKIWITICVRACQH